MLRDDAAWLLEQYRDEPLAAPGIPYAPLTASRVLLDPSPFSLTPAVNIRPVLAYDETIVRLARHEGETLWVQPCRYSDGVKSNYAMDGPGELRPVLAAEYGHRLPPFSDLRLANGIGVAVVVFDAEGRPYLPRRAPRQSVFPGGYHCTASGEAQWSEGPLTFEHLFTENICRELEEEVGLTRADLEWIRPVAFCREFLRAGKPQFFFAARTLLDEDELQSRRRAAIAVGHNEILDDVLHHFDPAVCTLECIANVTLAIYTEP
uniref:NUDIX hydrolase n=1 Tax=Solibacter usitatus (strain Ellin6076) TaxID=234267 RepID=Q01Q77_SOLUE